ncbi:MAG: DUF1694 domain-containing protein [Bacillota bacterium]
MNDKPQLEQYIEYGLHGIPEIRGEEKKHWLGEFRERVLFGLTFQQIARKDAIFVVEEKIKDSKVKKVIVSSNVNAKIAGEYMALAGKNQKDFKIIDFPERKGDVALILASDEAVNVDDVIPDQKSFLPDAFYAAIGEKLCEKHMEELEHAAPQYAHHFEKVTLFDKMVGIKCGMCEKSGGVMSPE